MPMLQPINDPAFQRLSQTLVHYLQSAMMQAGGTWDNGSGDNTQEVEEAVGGVAQLFAAQQEEIARLRAEVKRLSDQAGATADIVRDWELQR